MYDEWESLVPCGECGKYVWNHAQESMKLVVAVHTGQVWWSALARCRARLMFMPALMSLSFYRMVRLLFRCMGTRCLIWLIRLRTESAGAFLPRIPSITASATSHSRLCSSPRKRMYQVLSSIGTLARAISL